MAVYAALQNWPNLDNVSTRLLSALRRASRPRRQALSLAIPVAATLLAFPAVAVHLGRLVAGGGLPAAMLLVVTACALAMLALNLAPAPGEPDVHDRQLDVILAVPLVGVCVWLALGWPEHFAMTQALTSHQVVAATTLLAAGCLLVVGTRLTARLRLVLLMPLIGIPQITGHAALLALLLAATIAATLLVAIVRYRQRAWIAPWGTRSVADKLAKLIVLPPRKETHSGRDSAQRVVGSTPQLERAQLEAVSARLREASVSR